MNHFYLTHTIGMSTDQHDYPIGFFQLNSHHKFCQIALIPEVAGQGLGIQIVKHCVKLADIGKKVGWTCERHNIPSLKTLKALHGGIWNLRSYNSRKKVEGSFTLGKPESKQYQANVQYCLDNEVAIKEYEEWQKEYKKRKNELRDLKEYLTNYKR